MTNIPVGSGELVDLGYLNEVARAHYRKVTSKDVVNTLTITDLLNGEITIGAGAMSTSRAVRATITGDYLNNTGAGATLILAVKLGATTLWNATLGGGGGIPAFATRRPFRMTFEIVNLGATNSQQLGGFVYIGTATAPTTGLGDLSVAVGSVDAWATSFSGTAAEDTTSAKALVVSAQHNSASASLSCRLLDAVVEVV